jgi:hypothetical protein
VIGLLSNQEEFPTLPLPLIMYLDYYSAISQNFPPPTIFHQRYYYSEISRVSHQPLSLLMDIITQLSGTKSHITPSLITNIITQPSGRISRLQPSFIKDIITQKSAEFPTNLYLF